MNTARDFVVVDVETSGFDPAAARVLSVAALTITAGYKQSKHADRPLPDGVAAAIAARSGALLLRMWLAQKNSVLTPGTISEFAEFA